MRGYGKKGDLLDYSINKTLVALQQEILDKEGWPSAELRLEVLDAKAASQPKDSPEIRAYFERLWGPLKYPLTPQHRPLNGCISLKPQRF